MSTLVSVGNGTQSFARLLDGVRAIAAQLPQPVRLQHGHTPWHGDPRIEAMPFLDMQAFEQGMRDSELLILHAGAGSVIHAIRAGKVPVVMPRRRQYGEIVDDHQVAFADRLEQQGRLVVAAEAADLPRAVQQALQMQRRQAGGREPCRMVELITALLADRQGALR